MTPATIETVEALARELDPMAWMPLAFSTSDGSISKVLAGRREASLSEARKQMASPFAQPPGKE